MPDTPTLQAYWDESFLEHNPPAGEFEAESTGRLAVDEPHPGRPERVRNIKHIIEHALSDLTDWKSVTPATREQLTRVHTAAYVEEFEERSWVEDCWSRFSGS